MGLQYKQPCKDWTVFYHLDVSNLWIFWTIWRSVDTTPSSHIAVGGTAFVFGALTLTHDAFTLLPYCHLSKQNWICFSLKQGTEVDKCVAVCHGGSIPGKSPLKKERLVWVSCRVFSLWSVGTVIVASSRTVHYGKENVVKQSSWLQGSQAGWGMKGQRFRYVPTRTYFLSTRLHHCSFSPSQ